MKVVGRRLEQWFPRWRSSLLSVCIGQFLSLCIVGTGVFSTLIAETGVPIPTTQSCLLYILLAVLFGAYQFGYRRKRRLAVTWYKYIPVALADVEANYFVVKAYAYTSLIHIMLLDCLTIPFVMILARVFLGTSYSWKHVLVMLYTLGGAILLTFTDFASTGDEDQASWIGDLLCVASSICYAISNVCQEAIVKVYDRNEFLAMLGLFGTISGIQIAVLERDEWQNLSSDHSQQLGYIGGFVACMLILYAVVPWLIQRESAAFFNLSLLTADGWALLVGILIFGDVLSSLFWLAFVVIVSGIVLYNLLPEPGQKKGVLLAHGRPSRIEDERRLLAQSSEDAWQSDVEDT